jgi:hypothetical protein
MFNCLDNLVECASFGSRTSVRKFFVAAATAALLSTAGAANAATVTIVGTYTLSYTALHGSSSAVTLTGDLPTTSTSTGKVSSSSWNSSTHTESFTLSFDAANPTAIPAINMFAAAPKDTGTGTYANHVWSNDCNSACVANNYTNDGTITVTFNFTMPGVAGSPDLVMTGLYQAKYYGPALSCATGPGSPSSGKTDCVTWNNDPNPVLVTFTNGDTLSINMINAEDWTIYPQISFNLTVPTATPLPGALPLFVSGSGLLGFLGWRRQKRNVKAA